MAFHCQSSEFKSTLWCKDQDRAVECAGAFRQRVIIFDVKDGLNGDLEDMLESTI